MFSEIYVLVFIMYEKVPLVNTILKSITSFKNLFRKISL